MMPSPAVRFLPDEPLPPYTYVPGRGLPHPISSPAGHSHGLAATPPPRPDPDQWRGCRAYLRGLDLFNHGYYWEAHETWEALWHACGRRGWQADFFKGLIQLAVAGVKARQGLFEGVRGHALRAAELFQRVYTERNTQGSFGLDLGRLLAFAHEVARCPGPSQLKEAVVVVFPQPIVPE